VGFIVGVGVVVISVGVSGGSGSALTIGVSISMVVETSSVPKNRKFLFIINSPKKLSSPTQR
jgi:hypothetical protein